MGYLLKEVLKTLCGVNQWSYAVFWKIGCQNPKLLIWEEYYHEPASYSGPKEIAGNGTLENAFHKYNVQVNDSAHLLVNKMMTNNHVIVVGKGLVGRVAFTGNHQWILSETFYNKTHPPEVQKEVYQQFSDGLQTVAVIPVLPHGVVQFGSFLKIMENVGFVNQVTSLIVHLGYVSGIFQSEDYAAKGLTPRIGVPVYLQSSTPGALSLDSSFAVTPCSLDDLNCNGFGPTSVCQSLTSFSRASGVQNELQLDGASFQSSSSSSSRRQNHDQDVEIAREVRLDCSPSEHKVGRLVKADVIPTNSELWKKQHTGCDVSGSALDIPSSSAFLMNHGSIRFSEEEMLPETGNHGPFSIPNFSSGFPMPSTKTNSGLLCCSIDGYVTRVPVEVKGLFDGCPSNSKTISGLTCSSDEKSNADEQHILNRTTSAEIKSVIVRGMEASNSTPFDQLKANTFLSHGISSKPQYMDHKLVPSELKTCNGGITLSKNGDHLNVPEHIPGFHEVNGNTMLKGHTSPGNISQHDDVYAYPESGDDLFDVLGADFKNKLISDYWNSSPSNESTANMQGFANSLPAKQTVASGMLQSTATDHLLDAMVSEVQISAKSMMDGGTSCQATLMNVSIPTAPDPSLPYNQLIVVSENPKDELFGIPKHVAKAEAASSSHGSRFSSWVEDSKDGQKSEIASTGSSKKPDEISKTTRKRLKPGENPRPRPKDRQMIQDRVKELREIVPNAAKCSIDALLERTIKHLLFLQSVTKHADKLKQTGESKIISKDGGLLLRENLEGGATWAYEVGSQSMVCPIIVEDLHQPRQMLVEMLCEERGSFLEIADVIRGLGLTILKGIMETRNDKIWARFAVEANRDITRMEIFISLVHLLEQGPTSGVTQPNDISSKNMMAKQLQSVASVLQCVGSPAESYNLIPLAVSR